MKSKSVKLGSRLIEQDSKPYIIAEIGVNHEGSFEKAKLLIENAKKGGADAAKFQSYKAETLASKHSPSYWDLSKEKTTSQFKLFSKFDKFNQEEYEELSEYCKKIGIDFLSTPFDDNAIEYLDPLVPFFKIASADLTNIPFLRKVAKKKKPVVISTGAANLQEISEAILALNKEGCSEIILLHCILNYPTPNPQAHLKMINSLQKYFPDNLIGYSDHTLPDENMLPLISSWLLGAVVIEKHFTYDKSLQGNDHYHAMDQKDLERLCLLIENINILKGNSVKKTPIPSEEISRLNARRSIVLARSVKAGHIINEKDLTYKRPGTGISPTNWDKIIGSKFSKDLEEDTILKWEDIISPV